MGFVRLTSSSDDTVGSLAGEGVGARGGGGGRSTVTHMPHAAINGQNIYFEDTGGDGPVVVLGHGFLMDHEMFVHQVAALRDQYRVITWDERGFGLTEFDGQPFSYWDSAADCLGLMTHLVHRARRRRRHESGRLPLAAGRAHRARAGAGAHPAGLRRHARRCRSTSPPTRG
jgi:hypothetical protein